MISLQNLHIDSKIYIFLNTFKTFRPKCIFWWRHEQIPMGFIVYMFRWPSAGFNWVSDNVLISGFRKAHIVEKNKILKFFGSCHVFFLRLDWYLDSWVMRQQCGVHKFCVLLLNLQVSARFTCCPWMQNPHPPSHPPLPVDGSLNVEKLERSMFFSLSVLPRCRGMSLR